MVYSLSRYRHHPPTTPFRLGGEFLQLENQFFLRDAQGSLAINGDPSHFSRFQTGDQLVVTVTAVENGTADCVEIERVVTCRREWPQPPRPHAAEFAKFVNAVREFFTRQGCTEIFTPSLVVCPGLEPSLEPFAVAEFYLPTSPEIHLKKALSAGWTDIFEIKSCFRKGELSKHHQPEFTMLEWYRGFADLEMIRADLQALLNQLYSLGWMPTPASAQETTFAVLFKSLLGYDLVPQTSAADLLELTQKLGMHSLSDDTFNDLFHRLMIEHIEPRMPAMGPLVVRDFPPSMAALARLTQEGWADRFEFYWQGLEIANAFNEVNDPVEQGRRWQSDLDERARLGTSLVPIDPSLIAALESGMPPAGGIALGLERLYMACRNVDDIGALKFFVDKIQ